MGGWNLMMRILCVVLAIVLVIGLACLFLPRLDQARALQARKAALEQENRRKEQQIQDLKARQQKFSTDPSFVERTARDTGMAKADETVFRLTNSVGTGSQPNR